VSLLCSIADEKPPTYVQVYFRLLLAALFVRVRNVEFWRRVKQVRLSWGWHQYRIRQCLEVVQIRVTELEDQEKTS